MKKLFFALSMTALLLMAAGCEKEEFARPAVYGKISCHPNPARAGDTVTLTVEVLDPGNRIYHADYVWKCSSSKKDGGFDREEIRVTAPNGSKTIKAAPTFKCVFTSPGTYNVTMSARLKFSMGDVNGAMIGGASASGSIKVKFQSDL